MTGLSFNRRFCELLGKHCTVTVWDFARLADKIPRFHGFWIEKTPVGVSVIVFGIFLVFFKLFGHVSEIIRQKTPYK